MYSCRGTGNTQPVRRGAFALSVCSLCAVLCIYSTTDCGTDYLFITITTLPSVVCIDLQLYFVIVVLSRYQLLINYERRPVSFRAVSTWISIFIIRIYIWLKTKLHINRRKSERVSGEWFEYWSSCTPYSNTYCTYSCTQLRGTTSSTASSYNCNGLSFVMGIRNLSRYEIIVILLTYWAGTYSILWLIHKSTRQRLCCCANVRACI